MKLVNVTAAPTHAQTPLQTGDLKLAVDVITRISEKSLEIIYEQYPDASKRAEEVQKIAEVGVSVFVSLFVAHSVFSCCSLECNVFLNTLLSSRLW